MLYKTTSCDVHSYASAHDLQQTFLYILHKRILAITAQKNSVSVFTHSVAVVVGGGHFLLVEQVLLVVFGFSRQLQKWSGTVVPF